MGITKSDLFSKEQNQLADYAKVMGHPARIAILEYLLSSDTCINGELVDELGLAQATISQHLRELKQAGLIQGTVTGTRMNYCINKENWSSISELFTAFFRMLPNTADTCC